jgi:PAS domain S-box-containing protein
MNTELINQVKTLESQPPPKFSWTESNIEKFAVELNADSTFQEIASELHIKSEQWDYLFKNINQPLGVSRKGIIRDVNQTYVDQFGYTQDELIGKPIIEFIHPDEHKELKEVIASNKSDYVWRVKKKNGHYCRVRIQRQAFGDPDDGFSVALMECVEKGCPDCMG